LVEKYVIEGPTIKDESVLNTGSMVLQAKKDNRENPNTREHKEPTHKGVKKSNENEK